jgi:hypothetical protein
VREFAGDFETHLTLTPSRLSDDGDDRDDAVRLWATRHEMKYTRILLEHGRTPDQPMLTYRGKGTLTAQRSQARTWVERLHRDGLSVTRVKIEASPWNDDVPQSAQEAAALPPGCYFEHHVKLVLAGTAEVEAVRELSARHDGHLSRNARRVLSDGRHERFVTQRRRGVGRPEARQGLDALLNELAAAGHPAVEVEEEFVVHDDNPGVDAGWADGPARYP